MTISIFYFSGTGNTAKLVDWLAQAFVDQEAAVQTINIEDYCDGRGDREHLEAAAAADALIFAYPVQGSMAPMLVWQFVMDNKALWQGKWGAVVATQYVFSGDGAAYLARVLRKQGMQVKATEHFNMPNNLSDVRLVQSWVKNGPANDKILTVARQRAELFAMDFVKGRHIRIGDHIWGTLLGALQRVPYGRWERKLAKNVHFHCQHCTQCGICVASCPTQNLSLDGACVIQEGRCTICYRCVNACPERAISILSKQRPVQQYRG